MLFGLIRLRRRVHVDIASISECGPVRRENQDHILVNRRGLVFCVADGMGGGEGGGTASSIVCREMNKVLAKRTDFPERVRLVDDAVCAADVEVRAFASKAGYRQMGTTVTVLVADSEDGRSAAVGNIGDSRVYRLREGELRQLTRDHTMEREILKHRTLRTAGTATEMRASMLSHVLTRAVGVGEESRLDWRKIDMHAGDVFLLCSDGVYGFVKPDALKEALSTDGAAKEIIHRIGELVIEGGAGDNYSAIVVKIGGRA
jgi:serine/threonine protein phosphatase PrpC